jgi:hypothetical protein
LIVDCNYKHQKHRNSRHSGKKPPSEQEILTKRKCSTLQTSLQVSSLTTQMPKVTKRNLLGAECLEEEAKVCFISLALRFSSSVLPSSAASGPP